MIHATLLSKYLYLNGTAAGTFVPAAVLFYMEIVFSHFRKGRQLNLADSVSIKRLQT
jgi:hypothetical protein